MKDKKYYFLTYEGKRRDGDKPSKWNVVIDCSPLEVIAKSYEAEASSVGNGWKSYYIDFYMICCVEITKEEFEKYKGKF